MAFHIASLLFHFHLHVNPPPPLLVVSLLSEVSWLPLIAPYAVYSPNKGRVGVLSPIKQSHCVTLTQQQFISGYATKRWYVLLSAVLSLCPIMVWTGGLGG